MEKKERLLMAFNYLRTIGRVKSQKELAELMETTPSNVSAALKGNESALTRNFIRRFVYAFGCIISETWLATGDGQMLASPSKVNNVNIVTGEQAHDNNLGSTVNIQKGSEDVILQELVRTNSKLTETNSKLTDQIDRLTNLLDRLTK